MSIAKLNFLNFTKLNPTLLTFLPTNKRQNRLQVAATSHKYKEELISKG